MLFVEAPRSEQEIEALAGALPATPLVLNMFAGGKTPVLPLDRLAQIGFALVIVPSDLQRAALRAMEEAATAIRETGSSESLGRRVATFGEREQIVAAREIDTLASDLQADQVGVSG
jgi:2-methylisocitrate lyase-like PEP mutase family enzyme